MPNQSTVSIRGRRITLERVKTSQEYVTEQVDKLHQWHAEEISQPGTLENVVIRDRVFTGQNFAHNGRTTC